MSRLLFTQSAFRTAVRDVAKQTGFTRSFASFPTLRPSLSAPSPIFTRRPTTLLQNTFTPSPTSSATAAITGAEGAADIVPKSAITAHPALGQIRCGPRRYMNMNRPSRLIRQRRHGFLSRIRTKNGRKMLERRRTKGRKMLSA